MDFLNGNIKKLYHQMLLPGIMGMIVMSIYSFVDAIAVGQYEGALGSGAMSVINPLYSICIFFGIMVGIGGSVLFSVAKGEDDADKANRHYTNALILMLIITLFLWVLLLIFMEPFFRLLGANEDIMDKTMAYGSLIIYFLPFFTLEFFFASFVRCDGAPKLVTAAVIIGGCCNMFGDWFFVFCLDMGIRGAATATVTGTGIEFTIICSYYFQKNCTLKLIRPTNFLKDAWKSIKVGVSSGIIDLGSALIIAMMNRQITRYSSTNELAVFGVIATLLCLFQAIFCGVGQAIQPIVSTNFGAKKTDRYQQLWKLGLHTMLIIGCIFTVLGEAIPFSIVKLFMKPTDEVLAIAPHIFHLFFPMFLFFGIVILSNYYLQSILEENSAFLIGCLHSFIISGILIFIMPKVFGMNGLWLSMTFAEIFVTICGEFLVIRSFRANIQIGSD